MKKAIVSGSYDPFTYGHLDIVKQASEIFDQIHVVIFINTNKKRAYNVKSMVRAIEKTLEKEGISNCVVGYDEGLLAKYCEKNDIMFTVRGLRNNMDYNYEENISEVNALINPNLKPIYLRAENAALSSSMVRELFSFGEDVSKYVPEEILKVMTKQDEFYEAYNYLENHKIFDGNFNQCLDVEVVKINPKTRAVDDDKSLNTKTEIWLECGPYDPSVLNHDIDLDCGGYSFEEAIIELARLVKEKYD